MKKCLFVFVSMSVLGLGLAIAAEPAGGSAVDAMAITIKVSPNTIVLASKGTWVTVHADIAYSRVAPGTVEMNGLAAAFIFPDDRGDLVAKFPLAAVKGIVQPPQTELTLTGATKDDILFAGSETVTVRTGRQ